MATFKSPTYSNQIASLLTGVSVGTRNTPIYDYGIVRSLYEQWTTSTTGDSDGDSGSASAGRTIDIDSGDLLIVGRIPKGARIIGGQVAFGAMGASATLTLGLYAFDADLADGLGTVTDADLLLASEDVSAAGTTTIATNDVAPEVLGYEVLADQLVVATAGGADYADAKLLKISVLYVVD